MKGHTTIELTDVNTGNVERIEDDNMVTSAISQIVNFAMTHAYGNNPMTNMYTEHITSLMGGLLLFDTPIDETKIFPSAGNVMVGCGKHGLSTSYSQLPQLGLYNENESDLSNETTKKMVWDFTTSQANGRIASVCLTSKNAGYMGYGKTETIYPTGAGENVYFGLYLGVPVIGSKRAYAAPDSAQNYRYYGTCDQSFINFCIDAENDLKYMFRVDSNGLRILSHKMNLEKFTVFRSNQLVVEPYTEEFYEYNFGTNNYFYGFYNTDEKALYFYLAESKYSAFSALNNIYRFDMETEELSLHINRIDTGYSFIYDAVFTNEYVYYVQTNGALHRYHINSQTDEIIYNDDISSTELSYGKNKYIYNGLLFFKYSAGRKRIYDTAKNVLYALPSYTYSNFDYPTIIPPIDNTQSVFAGYNTSSMLNFENGALSGSTSLMAYAPLNYLATINNLAEPVIKTPDKTMKVIYTLTEE